MENSDEKEQRRKKIKELEASLFGAENQWTTFSTNTDLPELKNVNEYLSQASTLFKVSNFYGKNSAHIVSYY